MNKKYQYSEQRGLPGGPNEVSAYGQGFVVSSQGQWEYPGMNTAVPTPTGRITMDNVPYPVYGQDETGYGQMMYPGGGEYQFRGNMVYEIPYTNMATLPQHFMGNYDFEKYQTGKETLAKELTPFGEYLRTAFYPEGITTEQEYQEFLNAPSVGEVKITAKRNPYKYNPAKRSPLARNYPVQDNLRTEFYRKSDTDLDQIELARQAQAEEQRRKISGVIRETTDADREWAKEYENKKNLTFAGRARAAGTYTPLSDLLDVFNPTAYYYGAKDAVRGLGQTAEGIYNLDPSQVGSGLVQTGLGALSALPSVGTKSLAKPFSKFARVTPGQYKAIQSFANTPTSSARNILNITKNQLSKGVKGTSSLLQEVVGELMHGKANRQSIKKGNEWLQNWVNHPETKAKIDDDIDKAIDLAKFLSDPFPEVNLLNLIREQSKNFKPNVKEYSLSKQFMENLQQYLSKNSESGIHEGNWGINYTHSYSPYARYLIEKGTIPIHDKYGSWISRTLKLPQKRRLSTTIHEGAHDWVSEEAFKKSGMRDIAIDNMNPEIKKDFLEWEKLINKGIDPKTVMGKERAYQAYLADPTEQHARIMELRYNLGITPNYKMNLEDATKVLEWINKGGSMVDSKFLNVINNDPKKLQNLFNGFWAVSPLIGVGGIGALGAGLSLKDQKPKETYQMGGTSIPAVMRQTGDTEMGLPNTGVNFEDIPDDVLAMMIANNRLK
jgi:hypothetical protein